KENRNAKIAKERKERKGEQEGIHTSDQNVFVPLRVFVVRCTVFLRALCVVIRFLYLSRHLGFVPVAQSEPGKQRCREKHRDARRRDQQQRGEQARDVELQAR